MSVFKCFGIVIFSVIVASEAFSARPPASIFCGIHSIHPGFDLVAWKSQNSVNFYLRPGINPDAPIDHQKEAKAKSINLAQLKNRFNKMDKQEPVCWRTQWTGFVPSKKLTEEVKTSAQKASVDLSID